MKIDLSKIDPRSSAVLPKEYFEGGAAYPTLGICQNPYRKGTKEYDDWDHGWCDAEGYEQWTNPGPLND